MIKSRFLRNAGWIIGGRIFQMIISLFVSMITARYLGPSNYGVLTYTASFIAFFTSFATLGLNNTIIKELIDRGDKQGAVLGSSIVLRLCSSVLCMFCIVSLVWVLNPNDKLLILCAFLQSLSLMFQSFEILNYWYQSKLESKVSIIITSIAYIVMTIYKVAILIFGKNVAWFALANSLDILMIAILLYVSFRKHSKILLSFSFPLAKALVKNSYHFILSGLMVAIYGQMDKIMIGKMMDITAVGYYSTAVAICGMWTFLLMAIIQSATPIIIECRKENYDLYIRRIKQLYATIIWISIFVSLVLTLLAKPIILILYGEQYLSAAAALQIVTWYTMFSYIGEARGIWIVCENKQKYVKKYLLIGAVLNLILNALLIPRYGINGAAFATLVTQITTAVLAPLFFRETRVHTRYVIDAFLLRGLKNEPKTIVKK